MSFRKSTKNVVFAKRTLALLSPLFFISVITKSASLQANQSTLFPVLSNYGLEIPSNSALKLAEQLKPSYPKGIEDYGALLVKTSSRDSDSENLIIEQSRPFSSFSHGDEFSFETAENLVKKSTEEEGNSNSKHTISQSDFMSKEFRKKGDLNLLTVFDLTIQGESQPIPITNVIPFSDLVSSATKSYKIVSISGLEGSSTNTSFDLEVKKEAAESKISLEVKKSAVNNPARTRRSAAVEESSDDGMANLAIKSFYILFSDNPALNPYSYFSNTTTSIDGDNSDPYLESRIRKIFLDAWKNKSSSGGGSSSTTTVSNTNYSFSTGNDFWKSLCRDPFKVGGFIDTELKEGPASSAASPKSSSSDPKIKQQLNSFEEFKVGLNQKPEPKKQYYWDQITNPKDYVPHTDYTTPTPCSDMDDETKSTFKEFAGLNGESSTKKTLDNEPEKQQEIKKALIPATLSQKLTDSESSEEGEYPKHKIVQSAFRAWGNDYRELQTQGHNVKELGAYSDVFEKAMQSTHSFSLKVDKADWEKALVDHEKLAKSDSKEESSRGKKLNELKDISSQMQVFYPISFTLYDPVSNYLKKQTLFLKTELDLRFLYKKSSFVRKVFSYDIGSKHSNIGLDYQGYSISDDQKKKNFGLSGFLEFYAGMELDVDKNLKISLTAKVSGFVNTKNSTCDWRHRMYKWKSSPDPTKTDCSGSFAASSSSSDNSWKYRKHNHIPSFLVLSLEGAPEVSSFYVDRRSVEESELKNRQKRSTAETHTEVSSKKEKDIETLAEFKSKISEKNIVTSVDTDAGNDGEVYFERLAAYDSTTHETQNKIQNQISVGGWLSSTNHQHIYYYRPRKNTNSLEIDADNLQEIKLYVSGARAVFSQFFKSHHYGTIMTVCTSDKYSSFDSETGGQECGGSKKYEKKEEDKTESELLSSKEINPGTQEISFKYLDIKDSTSESSAKEVHFRRLLHWEKDIKDPSKPTEYSNKFSTLKDKLKELFKDDAADPTSSTKGKIPELSMLSIWYSIAVWVEQKDGKTILHYVTKLRPISLTKTKIDNSTAELVTGAAGSAGFNISRFEFTYSKAT